MCPIEIDELEFFCIAELADDLGVSRQTLWRWRNDGKIPIGHRFRDGRVLFTASEAEEIRRYANRLDPIEEPVRDQMSLFG